MTLRKGHWRNDPKTGNKVWVSDHEVNTAAGVDPLATDAAQTDPIAAYFDDPMSAGGEDSADKLWNDRFVGFADEVRTRGAKDRWTDEAEIGWEVESHTERTADQDEVDDVKSILAEMGVEVRYTQPMDDLMYDHIAKKQEGGWDGPATNSKEIDTYLTEKIGSHPSKLQMRQAKESASAAGLIVDNKKPDADGRAYELSDEFVEESKKAGSAPKAADQTHGTAAFDELMKEQGMTMDHSTVLAQNEMDVRSAVGTYATEHSVDITSVRKARYDARVALGQSAQALEGRKGMTKGEQIAALDEAADKAMEAAMELKAAAHLAKHRNDDEWQAKKMASGGLGLPSLTSDGFVSSPQDAVADLQGYAIDKITESEAGKLDADDWLKGLDG